MVTRLTINRHMVKGAVMNINQEFLFPKWEEIFIVIEWL